jgi:uncharacterized protein YqgC (DUF456 family)
MVHTIEYAVAIVLLVPAIFMALIPLLPSLAYMFVVAVIFAFANGFEALTGKDLALLFAFVAVSFAVDNVAGLLGAKYGGAHTKSLLWGVLGGIVGTFVIPVFGSLVGLFAAVFAAEIYYQRTRKAAARAASGALIGAAAGIATNVALAIGFLAAFIFLALR